MKSTGIVREIDALGRLCLPKELRLSLGIEPKDPIEIFVEGRAIVLRKHVPGCTFCGNERAFLVEFYPDKKICKGCVERIVKDQSKLVFS